MFGRLFSLVIPFIRGIPARDNKIAKQTTKHPRISHSKNITIVAQNTAVWLPEYVYISIRSPGHKVLLTPNAVI